MKPKKIPDQNQTYRLCQIGWCSMAAALLLYGFLCRKGIRPECVASLLPPCMFRTLAGFYCPGCGGTRAVRELLHGHLLRSLWYHPVVVYAAVLWGWYLMSNTIQWLTREKFPVGSRYHRWYGTGAVILVVSNWLFKNFLLLAFHITL